MALRPLRSRGKFVARALFLCTVVSLVGFSPAAGSSVHVLRSQAWPGAGATAALDAALRTAGLGDVTFVDTAGSAAAEAAAVGAAATAGAAAVLVDTAGNATGTPSLWRGDAALSAQLEAFRDGGGLVLTTSAELAEWMGTGAAYVWPDAAAAAADTAGLFCARYEGFAGRVLAPEDGTAAYAAAVGALEGALASACGVSVERRTLATAGAAESWLGYAFENDSRARAAFGCSTELASRAVAAAARTHRASSRIAVMAHRADAWASAAVSRDEVVSAVDFLFEDATRGFPHAVALLATGAGPAPGDPSVSAPSEVQVRVADMAQYVKDTLLVAYSPASEPYRDTITVAEAGHLLPSFVAGHAEGTDLVVAVDVEFTLNTLVEVHVGPGTFHGVVTVDIGWTDSRLEWDEGLWAGAVEFDPEDVWKPHVKLENVLAGEEVLEELVSASAAGRVLWQRQLEGTFTCGEMNTAPFPFDGHTCDVLVGLYDSGNVCMYGNASSARLGSDVYHSSFTVKVPSADDDPTYIGVFSVRFERIAASYYLRLIVPTAVLNLVGFGVFWIVDASDCVALGVTTMLCTLAMKDTVDMPDTSEVTFAEAILIVSYVWQFVTLLCTFTEYSTISLRIMRWMLNHKHTLVGRALLAFAGDRNAKIAREQLVEVARARSSASSTPRAADDATVKVEDLDVKSGDGTLPVWPLPRTDLTRSRTHFDLAVEEDQIDVMDRFGRYVVIPSYFVAIFAISLGMLDDAREPESRVSHHA